MSLVIASGSYVGRFFSQRSCRCLLFAMLVLSMLLVNDLVLLSRASCVRRGASRCPSLFPLVVVVFYWRHRPGYS